MSVCEIQYIMTVCLYVCEIQDVICDSVSVCLSVCEIQDVIYAAWSGQF